MESIIINIAIKISAMLVTFIPVLYALMQKTHWGKLQHAVFVTVALSAFGQATFGAIREILSIIMTFDVNVIHMYMIEYVFISFQVTFYIAYAFYIIVSCGFVSKTNSKLYLYFLGPTAIFLAVLGINPWTHIFFEFLKDESVGRYVLRQNIGYHFLWAVISLYALATFILFRKKIKHIDWKKICITSLTAILIVAGIVLDVAIPNFHISVMSEAIAVLCALVWIENEEMAFVHPGTGLYNHEAFIKCNESLLEDERKYKVFCISLLNHEYIRRTFDEDIRVRVCDMAAKIIKKETKHAIPYYLRNGRFAFFFYRDEEEEKDLIERLKKALEQSFEPLPGLIVETNWQIAIICMPDDVNNPRDLDVFFEGKPSDNPVIIRRSKEDIKLIKRKNEILEAFERGIKDNNFEVYYQPIYDSETKKIISAEALLRLNDPLLGRISPGEFIPISEASGHIRYLGRFVFKETIKFYKENKLDELGIEAISVNVSIKQLMRHENLALFFMETVKEFGIDSKRIILEVTESEDASTSDFFRRQFATMSNAGFSLALDDYGTGYSNLARVVNYNFAIIKMDISLLRNAIEKKGKNLLKNSIRSMKSYGFLINQEGVETRDQLNEVIDYGARFIQGFLISPPVPGREFVEFVKNFKGVDDLPDYQEQQP